MQQMSVRRLLSRRVLSGYLERFAALLPDVTIALLDVDGALVAEAYQAADGAAASPSAGAWECVLPLAASNFEFGVLAARGGGLNQPCAAGSLQFLHNSLVLIIERALESRSLAQETLERYREINLLYNIGQTISASLDPDVIPDLVIAEATRIIQVQGGIVLLFDEADYLTVRSSFGDEDFGRSLYQASRALLQEALISGDPHIWTDGQLDDRSHAIASLLEAPLKTRERILGFVLLGRGADQPVFTADDEKLLSALASQAAIAMENARLFADVKSQRDAIAEMKNYMDNIFASIASGVITTDAQDTITLMNRSAERILGVLSDATLGRPYIDALPEMGVKIAPLVDVVKNKDESLIGYEMEPVLPKRGPVVLRLNLSPLKDNREATNGIAIVVDDLTERRQLEAQARRIRQTFEQYVVPHVVEQLLSDPDSVRLGGARREVTTLFADIRGFTAFSEKLAPEATVEVLNRYLTLASEAILSEEGTLDKFFGDGVMAIFNAPLSQTDHTLRAVRSALKILDALKDIHAQLPPEDCLSFGIGITTGAAVVGSIGSHTIKNYTAIGDSVSLASRLQSHAAPRQILLNVTAYERVRIHVNARELGYVQVKGHSEPDLVFEVLGLR
ncbi:MAG TPA: adenylate/guanylate cyclase domain-containing protein [Anaerolineae bacterium]|nr:adenylate/guanylate cyclase domain-containing protein [Anaerolineae bacterium]HQI84170.1 adenylate/guanylate cyclase domain-containing protein [Anaerolineae bacterium]